MKEGIDMELNPNFLLNMIGRNYLKNINNPIIPYLEFYEHTYKEILINLEEVKRKNLVYLIEPYTEQVAIYKDKVESINTHIATIGLDFIQDKVKLNINYIEHTNNLKNKVINSIIK